MRKRRTARLFTVTAVAIVGAMAVMPAANANNPSWTGGGSAGSYDDQDFGANSHEVHVDWIRGSQSTSGRGEISGYIDTNA
jgi:hypothetical protein